MDNRQKYETTYYNAEEVRRQSQQHNKKKRRKNRGLRALIYIVSVVLVSALLAGFGWLLANDLCAFNKPYKETTVVVTENDSVSDVANKLKKEGLINYKFFFRFVSKFMHAQDKIDVGEYTLNTDMDYRSLIANMHDYAEDRRKAEGLIRITIPEGMTVRQIIDLLAEKGVATTEELEDACANYEFKDYPFLREDMQGQINRMEGFLFPDTYDFNPNKSAVYAIDTLLTGFVNKIDADVSNAIERSGHSLYDIITLASIIEKEGTGDETERKNISSVLYNRLANTESETYGYLQMDTTVYYALSLDGKERSDFTKEYDSSYNTYLHPGLPSGPICNPGMGSIAAAIFPNETDYYYFAAGKDGASHFFTNLDDHNAFVNSDMYQPD